MPPWLMLEVKSTRPRWLVYLYLNGNNRPSAFMEEENDDKNPWWFSVFYGMNRKIPDVQ